MSAERLECAASPRFGSGLADRKLGINGRTGAKGRHQTEALTVR